MSQIGVPLIDISPSYDGTMKGKRRVAKQINAACIDLGFFAISGHHVPLSVIHEVLKVSHAFFEQPISKKLKALHPVDGTPRGYRIFSGEALGRAATASMPPDLKEFYHIGPDKWPNNEYYTGKQGRKYFIPNIWPDTPKKFRSAVLAYYEIMEELERQLLRLSAIALGISEEFFDDKVDKHISAMRINHYPPQQKSPLKGQFRAGAHTDYGGMTILVGEDEMGGLQVRTRSGDWVNVQTQPEYFIVNIGDLLMHWTNDAWVSNLHRVSNPPAEVARTSRRISIAFFHQPNYNALIECIPTCASSKNPPRYPPVRSGDYRDQKYTDTLIND